MISIEGPEASDVAGVVADEESRDVDFLELLDPPLKRRDTLLANDTSSYMDSSSKRGAFYSEQQKKTDGRFKIKARMDLHFLVAEFNEAVSVELPATDDIVAVWLMSRFEMAAQIKGGGSKSKCDRDRIKIV
ncbi:hypothetical protein BGZ58_003945 [Dissophora ornata]|nr:hypothetical protein BGZ58_003945 [Dissophora ornata]